MSDIWVFGYGSLMWNPGFEFLAKKPARLFGYHRALCVYSWVHRGSKQYPGLVLGLDSGGSCKGLAFQIEERRINDTLNYLREREQITKIYCEISARIQFEDGTSDSAITYRVDRNHPQYATNQTLHGQIERILRAQGASGKNPDYVINTYECLNQYGIRDRYLETLTGLLRQNLQTST